jgi:F-type H+-transporting ATPase subunit b
MINQTLNSFSGKLSDLALSLNTDIFETNVINITILLAGIIYLGSNALSTSLSERQQKILGSIQESEERLAEATAKLTESEKQLTQAQLVIDSINTDAKTTASNVKVAILADGKVEIERLTAAAKSQVTTIEAKVKKQISDYVIALALQRVTLQLEGKINSTLQQQIIDRNISKLGD